MKHHISLLLLLICACGLAQTSEKMKSAKAYQMHLNEEFRNPEESPLSEEEIKEFKGLEFFKIDTAYTVEANFVRTPGEAPFVMPTTTERQPVYVKYGELYFFLKGKKRKLNVYQNQSFLSDPELYDYLFVPFTDDTNGETTYSGGRYMDLRIPEGDSIILDFNKAYNPYCAYSGNYSCPIPPEENHLDAEIAAGVKSYKK
ncbi:DUF1684 domain-containing protein [Zunongwangia sp. F363]|uniref:DUF1684 domain-containing protein n=1 Tax=Autumnicola tepida TaxID=3075595 RepID=A0ABU3CDN0_9FLAO|nr:DUF1684 domain-containing protein [Zunongwangia sp. F363]MDT0644448.1 DUF1684 domain-containing protein [Zunongwangia sp. F363]